jgi:hypothetical protein
VQAGAQPWQSAFAGFARQPVRRAVAYPRPRETVECGSHSNPNFGCSDEREDALAAYADALVWYLLRDDRYATKAITIMDAWSATLKTHTNSNALSQTGWAGWAGRGPRS